MTPTPDILILQAVERLLASLGVQSADASSVVQYLKSEGIDLVPVTIIGAAGWTPRELWAYQCGIMHERHKHEERFYIDE